MSEPIPVTTSRRAGHLYVFGEWLTVIIRGLIVLTGLVLNNTGWLSPDPAVQGPFNVLVVSVGALDLLLLLILGLGRVPPIWLSQLMALVDTIGLLLVVVVSGGTSSPYFAICFLILLIAALRAGPVLALTSGGLVVLGYGALALPVLGDLLTGSADPDLVRLVVTRWSTLFLATIFAVLFARQQQAQRRQRAAAQSRSETLTVLLSTNQALDSPTDIHTVLHTIAEQTARAIGAAAGAVYLWDDQTDEWASRAQWGQHREELAPARFRPGQGTIGWVGQRGQPLHIPDVAQDARFVAMCDAAHHISNTLAVPLLDAGRVVGVLEVCNKPGGFKDGAGRKVPGDPADRDRDPALCRAHQPAGPQRGHRGGPGLCRGGRRGAPPGGKLPSLGRRHRRLERGDHWRHRGADPVDG